MIIGRRVKLAHVRMGGLVVEVSTFREKPSRWFSINRWNQNQYGQDIFHDSCQRDFTLNALYFDIRKSIVLDFHRGIEDFKNKKIFLIGNPNERYKEDPVRMLRAIKFMVKLNLQLEERTGMAIYHGVKYLQTVNRSRLFEEIIKLASYSAQAFFFLYKFRLLSHMIVGTEDLSIARQYFFFQLLNYLDRQSVPQLPSLIFSVLIWPYVQSTQRKLLLRGLSPRQAFLYARQQALKDQNQIVSLVG